GAALRRLRGRIPDDGHGQGAEVPPARAGRRALRPGQGGGRGDGVNGLLTGEKLTMRTVRVAAVSMNGFLGEPERVLGAVAGWCERAAAEGAELLLFPELVVHGHCTPNTWELAEAVPDGPSVRRLCALAKHYRQVLCVGMSEKERDIVYNTQVLVGP